MLPASPSSCLSSCVLCPLRVPERGGHVRDSAVVAFLPLWARTGFPVSRLGAVPVPQVRAGPSHGGPFLVVAPGPWGPHGWLTASHVYEALTT